MPNPTVVITHLDDKELKESIDKLVQTYKDGLEDMVSATNTKVEEMQNKLKTLGSSPMFGGDSADSGSSKRTKDLSRESEFIESLTLHYNNLAQAIEKLISAKSSSTRKENVASDALGGKSVSELTKELTDTKNQITDTKNEIAGFEDAYHKLGEKIKSESAAFIEARNKIIALKQEIRTKRADIGWYEYHKGKGEEIGTTEQWSYEKALKELPKLEQELKKLWDGKHNIPAPNKEDALKYQELESKILSLKDALSQLESQKNGYETSLNTVAALKESIKQEEEKQNQMQLSSDELRQQNALIAQQKTLLKEELMTEEELAKKREKESEEIERQQTKQLKKSQAIYNKELNAATTLPTKDLAQTEEKLRRLQDIQSKMRASGLFDEAKLNKVQNSIDSVKKKIESLKASQPKSLKDVLGMDESSVDAIAKKMAALKKVQINPANKEEAKKLSQAYQDLAQKQNNLLGKNAQVAESNLSLARSFGYIRNRLAYALTLGALTKFVKDLYEIRGQYEMLERSLGILTNDMRKGTEIFNELNEMALKSPFTLVELGTAAKQLTAYNFAAEEVVDTTRRLADISAALGVPMERLTYNLGQIKAQGVLNARDARDFANAGFAIVPMLAQMYTEQKRFGDEMVTTAQVYDMMSKKMVTYKDVLSVITRVTDEGGKFFDYQAKQAETLRVKMANLTLALNNMLNEIGEEQQSALELPLKGLKLLFENWKTFARIISEVVIVLGTYRTMAAIVTSLNSRMFVGGILVNLRNYVNGIKAATGAMATLNAVTKANPIGLLASAIAAVVGYFWLFNDSVDDATGYVERFGKAGAKVIKDVESLFDSLEGMTQGTSNYKKVMGELNSVLDEYGVELVNEKDGIDVINEKRKVAIDLIKQETLERKHLNDIQQGKETYDTATEAAKKELEDDLKNAILTNVSGKNVRENAPAIANIISDVVENNIMEIAGKTGEEYEKGLDKIYRIIQDRMRAIGLSEKEVTAAWFTEGLFYHDAIIEKYIGSIQEAKESQDRYNESTNKAYESEKKAAEASSTFQDKVDATSRSLMKSANDTDALHSAINQIIKDYSGQNIIDFLVRVNAQVPKWMMNKSVSELSQLAARFAALAKNARGNVIIGNTKYTKEQLATRAALYAQAAQQKQANIESEKTTTITQKASDALKEYKQALEGVKVAQNLVKQGQKDASFVAKKQAEEQEAYNKALKAGVSEQELLEAKNGKKKSGGSKKDELGDALSKEIQYISDIQKRFKEYQKMGVDAQQALTLATDEYSKSIVRNNNILRKYGFKTLSSEQLATMPLQKVRDFYQEQLEGATASAKGVEVLEKAIASLNVEITKIDYKRITDGLNNELSKIKDEYELAVELDANPELGGMFAEMFDIRTTDFPKTIDEYMQRVQAEFDKARQELNLASSLDVFKANIDDWYKWGNAVGYTTEQVDNFKKSFDNSVGVAKKWAQDTIKQTQDLQYKLADTNGKIAIEQEKLETLKQKLAKETNKEQRRLLELQIQDQQHTIERLGDEVLQLLPTYKSLFNSIAEHSDFVTRRIAKQWKNALKKAVKNADGSYTITDPNDPSKTATISKKEYGKNIDKVDKELQKTASTMLKIKDAFSKGEDKEKDFAKGLELVGQEAQKTATLLRTIVDIVGELGGSEKDVETINDIATTIEGLGTAAQGYAKLQSGDYIGGATDMVKGTWSVIKTWSDNSNKKISREIAKSEREVRKLESTYKDLEQAIEEAYGMSTIGAQRAALANKELQLVELQRQLRLEESRRSKDKDNRRIEDLREQIKDLQREIKRTSDAITNDLLGISSIGSFAEDLVSSMISAFKNGEDYMLTFEESFDKMIDNIIMKSIVSRVVAQYLDAAWADIDKLIKARTESIAEEQAKFEQQRPKDREEMVKAMRKAYEPSQDEIDARRKEWEKNMSGKGYISSTPTDDYFKALIKSQKKFTEQEIESYANGLTERSKQLEAELKKASVMSDGDIHWIMSEFEDAKDSIFAPLVDELKKWYTFGESASEDKLSALQQGIQGITEDTAGALEAITNGISQQSYLQSDLLTQIRDTILGFDLDTQMGVLSEILLQLQSSYQIQMSIRNTLQGWSNASGMAVRVEMV